MKETTDKATSTLEAAAAGVADVVVVVSCTGQCGRRRTTLPSSSAASLSHDDDGHGGGGGGGQLCRLRLAFSFFPRAFFGFSMKEDEGRRRRRTNEAAPL
jgi:hypothetical protein